MKDAPYQGVIIAESLEDSSVLDHIKIISTEVEPIEDGHQTPWLKQWTLHTVEISADQAEATAQAISQALDREHGGSWYADFKNDQNHYIVFRGKVFQVDRTKPEQYKTVKEYGRTLGIPEAQLDFSIE